jgi:hypothetical protein
MLCFIWLALTFLQPLPTCPPLILIVLLLVTLVAHRPCPYCLTLFLTFLLLPFYDQNWPRWDSSIFEDVAAQWRIDGKGRMVPGFWNGLQAWFRFLTLPRPHPIDAVMVTL